MRKRPSTFNLWMTAYTVIAVLLFVIISGVLGPLWAIGFGAAFVLIAAAILDF